jgi:hypothetical protein
MRVREMLGSRVQRSFIMNRVSTFAIFTLVMCLASAVVGGQTVTRQSTSEAQNATTRNVAPKHAERNDNGHDASANSQKEKKGKDKSKPAPSRGEQEFERVLQGIYG